jgi:DNA-binding XRE family transcriptional regulator
MKKSKPFAALAAEAKANPARRERIAAYERAIEDALTLAELRENRALTQQDVARTLEVSQANISRIEHEEDLYLSTLRSYVAALGGELELSAVFPDRRVKLVGTRAE